MVFARTQAAGRNLSEQFRRGRVNKRYIALVTGQIPDSGAIALPLSRDPSHIGRRRASRTATGGAATTKYVVLHRTQDYTVVELEPLTGRTHQIRAHLSAIGAPILGDKLYGGAVSVLGARIDRCLLHARSLQLLHPTTGAMFRLEAPFPKDMTPFLGLISGGQ
jgi:23S rRNA pseudouridine1911/1915/1917 synthase